MIPFSLSSKPVFIDINTNNNNNTNKNKNGSAIIELLKPTPSRHQYTKVPVPELSTNEKSPSRQQNLACLNGVEQPPPLHAWD